MSASTSKRLKKKIVAKKKAPRRVRRASADNLIRELPSEPQFGTRKRRKNKISRLESVLRIERVRRAEANNRIEGISSDTRSNSVFAAYIDGDIEVTEIVPRLKLLYRVP
jgi:hypothetical protein